MAKGPVEVAHPQQYLRLLLLRLLETQRCLQPLLQRPEMGEVRRQFQENVYILSEVKSWLEAQETSSPLGPSISSARGAEKFGPGSTPSSPTTDTSPTKPANPFAWRTPNVVSRTESQVLSSMPSNTTLPDSAEVLAGKVTFQPAFLAGKRKDTSNGGSGQP